jgi:serine/threonine protein phosphatase PrpC
MSRPHFTYGLASETGSRHDANHDSVMAVTWSDIPRFEGQDVGLFIVADGVGAAESSGSPSQLAVQIVTEEIKTALFQPSDLTISQIMTAAIQKANLKILAEAPPDGVALTAALIINDQLTIVHAGDCRAYYAYGKYLIQLTDDHRFLQRLVDEGHYTKEQVEAGDVQFENVLYRALGQKEELEVDILTEQLAEGSCVLLSTNGLSGWHWSYQEQIKVLSVIQDKSPQVASNTLIDLAQQAGVTDDISVIVVKFDAIT